MLANSTVRMTLGESATRSCTVFMDGLNFLNSNWQIYLLNLNMINTESTLLWLDINYSANVRVENSTFGFWMFSEVQNVIIKNGSSVDEAFPPSLTFNNSSGSIENSAIKKYIFC